jgi:NADH:ubiquinone oxidoreductase subunit D
VKDNFVAAKSASLQVVEYATNIKIDLRLIGYEYYSNIRFNVVTGVKGDCLSRYLIRMKLIGIS